MASEEDFVLLGQSTVKPKSTFPPGIPSEFPFGDSVQSCKIYAYRGYDQCAMLDGFFFLASKIKKNRKTVFLTDKHCFSAKTGAVVID